MQKKFTTPMMRQYQEIKEQYNDCLLFFRAGDFYEMFLEDAVIGSQVLNITLTSKSNSKDGKIPMAGIPYHAVDSYLSKLVKAGFKVAICEQVSLPNKYGIVDREVVRVVTPGTVLDEHALEKKTNNFIVSLTVEKNIIAIACADISTGHFSAIEIESHTIEQQIINELARIQPSECILPEHLYNDPKFLSVINNDKKINIFPFQEWNSYAQNAETVLKKHFQVSTLACFAIEEKIVAKQAAAVLISYLQQTQKSPVRHIRKIEFQNPNNHLIIDRSSIINLELFTTIREHSPRGTLLAVMDHTCTAAGGRLLKQWMKEPLIEKSAIEKRHEAVESFFNNFDLRETLRSRMKETSDIERVLSRLSVGLGNGRDLRMLVSSLKIMVEVKDRLRLIKTGLIKETASHIDNISIQENIISLIESMIVEEPPFSIREGGIFKPGVNKELDRLRKIVGGSREWIANMEKQEKERTGISSLKIRFNKVFGFYIEVSKPNLPMVPNTYIRKQTIVNGERFITEELKKQEEIILTSEEQIKDLEYKLFQETLLKILQFTEVIQEAAQSMAVLDCLLNFAYIAQKYNYSKPSMFDSGEMRILAGKHPVVENLLEEKQYVPNDVILDKKQQLLIITGPNMAGKSVLIRQTALIVLMAQIGSFVPAQEAQISIVDRIFVRSGASDVITSGLSTFMVEMVETAHILHYATDKSLIIMDEIGRGTSTFDGMSIAWAVIEYLVTHYPAAPKTLFATHYHELQELEKQFPYKIKNYHMSVASENGEPIFLYTLAEGGASHSFGIAVAKLAGIPETVISRSKILLENLEKKNIEPSGEDMLQLAYKRGIERQEISLTDHIIHRELESIDIHQMTPLEALNKLAELKGKLRLLTMQNNELVNVD